jgi:hypothetical protein
MLAAALVVGVMAWLVVQSRSLRSEFRHDVQAALRNPYDAPVVTDADLASLPSLIQRYLRRVGAVGKPRVRNFQAVFSAEMRGAPDAPWMQARAEQYEFFGPSARFFFMRATRGGIPFIVFHRYVGDQATMRVRVMGLVPVANQSGGEMTQSETVTLFNDMCILAPATLVEAPVNWDVLDEHNVRGTLTNASHTVSAVLTFDSAGDLVAFRSEDRSMSEGEGMRRLPWTTPVSNYRDFGGVRLAALGEARWTDGARTWAYGRFVLERITYNVAAAATP